jgi:hypothetical protein
MITECPTADLGRARSVVFVFSSIIKKKLQLVPSGSAAYVTGYTSDSEMVTAVTTGCQ